jgi:sugar lactone lactonase YvrE
MIVGSLGGQAITWCSEVRDFPNGRVLSEGGSALWAVESNPGRLWKMPTIPDGRAGDASRVTDSSGVPDEVTAVFLEEE